MNREEIFAAIEEERERQNRRHPKWRPELAVAIVTEEVGEVAEAWARLTIETVPDTRYYHNRDLRSELIQVAAVCVRWLEEDF